MSDIEAITNFLETTKDAREYKRALAVRLLLLMVEPITISEMLHVSPAFISKWKTNYFKEGVSAFTVKYHGYDGYFTKDQHDAIISWIKEQNSWDVDALSDYIQKTYRVSFTSLQSYYDFFAEAGITWKRAQSRHPAPDPQAIAEKKRD